MRIHSIMEQNQTWKNSVQAQDINECGVTAPANALNIVYQGTKSFDKNDFLRQAGWFFQRGIGGTPSFITAWLLKRNGAGTHFGNIAEERGGNLILKDLIDRNLVVCIELGANKIGPITVFGQHSVVLTGYGSNESDIISHYFILDSEIKGANGQLISQTEWEGTLIPGNRILERQDFWKAYPTGIYFPVFPDQASHDTWYKRHIRAAGGKSLLRKIKYSTFTGTPDEWVY